MKHQLNLIHEWFEWVDTEYINDWLGNSPDFIAIENLWSMIKHRLQCLDTSTVPKLIAHIQVIWDELEPFHLQNLHNLALSPTKQLQGCL